MITFQISRAEEVSQKIAPELRAVLTAALRYEFLALLKEVIQSRKILFSVYGVTVLNPNSGIEMVAVTAQKRR